LHTLFSITKVFFTNSILTAIELLEIIEPIFILLLVKQDPDWPN
jgi:hypothetical protein